MNNLQHVWANSLELIKSELTEVSFNTWLGSIEPINIGEDFIVLSTPNDFNKQILEDRYLILIKNAVKQVTKKITKSNWLYQGKKLQMNFKRKKKRKTLPLIY